MKKYFMKESGEELQFGDMMELDFTKEMGNHTIHKHLECKFYPSLVQQLLDDGIIIEKELLVEPADEENDDDYNEFDDLMDTFDLLLEKIDLLTNTYDSLIAAIKENTKATIENTKAHAKTADK